MYQGQSHDMEFGVRIRSVILSQISLILLYMLVSMSLFGWGQPEAEQLSLAIDPQEKAFISPGNIDGVQDTLTIPFASTIDLPEGQTLSGYEFNVYDVTGALAFQISEKQAESRKQSGSVEYEGDPPVVPDAITWDGKDSGGTLFAEGEYTYQLVFFDSSGQRVQSPPFALQIDNTAPVVDPFPRPRNALFSPNGDEVRDTVTIFQSGSRELEWEIRIIDEQNQVVYSSTIRNDSENSVLDVVPLAEFEWDGMGLDGTVVGDGYYRYVLAGKDRAGNETTATHPRSIIVSQEMDLLMLSPKIGASAFSPNSDGQRDVLELEVDLFDEDRGDNWSLVFAPRDNLEETLYLETGDFPVPSEFAIDGFDSNSRLLPDGDYVSIFTIYEGDTIITESFLDVTIDTKPPRATLSMQTLPLPTTRNDVPFAFGGENRTSVDIEVRAEEGIDWYASLIDQAGNQYQFPLKELGFTEGVLQIVWAGQGPDGSMLPDATYSVRIEGIDDAGNLGGSRTIRVQKDTRVATIGVTIEKNYVGGPENRVPIEFSYDYPESIEEFLMEIRDAEGKVVRSEYKRNPFSLYEWSGTTSGNTLVEEGEYFVSLEIKYYNGNNPKIEGQGPIIADLLPPEVYDLSAPYRVFSPNGDGRRDSIPINLSVEETGEPWTAEIQSSGNVSVQTFDLGLNPDSFVWSGRDEDDRRVPDGDYLYVLIGRDIAGNVTREILPIVVDTGLLGAQRWTPQVAMEVGPQPFTPDGDGENDQLNITFESTGEEAIAEWTLNIIDSRGSTFFTQEGTGAPEEAILWDGLAESGELLQPADTYTVQLLAKDVFGNLGTIEESLETGIFLEQLEDGRLRISISSIYFGGYLSDFLIVSEEQLQANLKTVRTLARILNKFERYAVRVDGYAAHLLYDDEARREVEQREILLPLSRARAENVRRALVILGVDRTRMSTEGFGGDSPIVPHSDIQNRWKNRRVEFILIPLENTN